MEEDDILLGEFAESFRRNSPEYNKQIILYAVSLVTCEPSDDFDPTKALISCRYFPHVNVIANFPIQEIKSRITQIRPAISSMNKEDMAKEMSSGLFTDRNDFSIPTPPIWREIFDYYEIDPGNTRFTAVGRKRRKRTGTASQQLRKVLSFQTSRVLNRLSPLLLPFGRWQPNRQPFFDYEPTSIEKLPRQAEFDNIHIAPKMIARVFGRKEEVFMAPICQHDCLHMHWRWGKKASGKAQYGWGRNGPNTVPGAPMVPLNQTVEIELIRSGVGLHYDATVVSPRLGFLEIMNTHGAAYGLNVDFEKIQAIMVAVNVFLPKLLGLPGRIAAAPFLIPSVTQATINTVFPQFYYSLRYNPIDSSGREWVKIPNSSGVLQL